MTALGCALPLLFALTSPAPPPPSPADAFPVRNTNDVRHFVVSFGAVAPGAAGLRWLGMDRRDATLAAVGVGAALGIGKELWDAARGDRIDPLDLAWDAAGIALGALLAGATR